MITLDTIQTLLRDIQRETKVYPYCAGGAIRDIMLGRPVKDIDLFLPVDGAWSRLNKFFGQRANLPADRTLPWAHPEATYQGMKAITPVSDKSYDSGFSVYNTAMKLHGYPIQLIDQDDGFAVESFDIGLCQAALNPDTLRTTTAFKHDRAHRLITLLKSPENDSDNDHLARVQAKYPDYRLRRAYL